jgi:hypothetical protein
MTSSRRWPLELEIAKFGREKWQLRDAVCGILATGEVGSGKSSAVGQFFARKYLEAGMGGLVLCNKHDEKDRWLAWLKKSGREKDGIVFEIGGTPRFNFLDFESKQQGGGIDFIDNLITLLLDIVSVRHSAPFGSEASFWLPQKRLLLRNALGLLLLAKEPLTLGALNDIMQSSPASVPDTKDRTWQNQSYLWKLLKEAETENSPEFATISHYWLYTRAALPPKTRAIIDAEFLSMVDGPLSRGPMSDLFSEATNIDPTECFRGKIVIVNIPVDRYRESAQYAALIWSTAFMRATMRRDYQPPGSSPVFLYVDEAQSFTTELDAEYHATCRSKGVCVVKLTQNIPGFVRAFGGGQAAQITVDTILGNLVTKIFLKNSDPTTNAWASKAIAQDTIYKTGVSHSNGSLNTSMSQHEEDSCSPKQFLGLKNGGKANKGVVSAVVFQSGRLLSGARWIIGEFRQ